MLDKRCQEVCRIRHVVGIYKPPFFVGFQPINQTANLGLLSRRWRERSIGLKEAIKYSIGKLNQISRISLYENNLWHCCKDNVQVFQRYQLPWTASLKLIRPDSYRDG